MRFETYWRALRDLPVDAVQWGCAEAIKEEPHFPVPLTLRQYAKQYRDDRLQQAAHAAAKLLPQWTTTPDEVGLAAIRDVLSMLGDSMEMKHPVYQEPSMDDPEKRRAELLAQAQQIINHHQEGH